MLVIEHNHNLITVQEHHIDDGVYQPFAVFLLFNVKPRRAVKPALQLLMADHHYDALVDENNDPVRDLEPLHKYMDKWDGQVFLDELQLSSEKSALETDVGTGRLDVKVEPLCRCFIGIDIPPKLWNGRKRIFQTTKISL